MHATVKRTLRVWKRLLSPTSPRLAGILISRLRWDPAKWKHLWVMSFVWCIKRILERAVAFQPRPAAKSHLNNSKTSNYESFTSPGSWALSDGRNRRCFVLLQLFQIRTECMQSSTYVCNLFSRLEKVKCTIGGPTGVVKAEWGSLEISRSQNPQ